MKVWWCDALAEAWDMELHDQSPCDKCRAQFGNVTEEHDRCGPMRLIPDNAETIECNVVAVRPRQAPDSDMFREPWLVMACAVEKPEKPARYWLVPFGVLSGPTKPDALREDSK